MARDPLGKVIQGTVDATNSESATQTLQNDGFTVLKLEEDDQGLSLFPRRIKKNDIIFLTSQLAVMVDTGINLAAALEGIGEQEENPTLKSILRVLKNKVEAGEDFSLALASYPKHFDKTYISLVKSSEQTGTLGETLEQIATYLRKELDNRNKVKAALTYPLVMLCLAVGVTIFLLTFVMPKFTPLFKRKGVELPTPTIIMMAASESLINYWYLWLLGVAALVIGFLYGRKTEPGRKILDWIKINLPIVGPMFRKVTISRSLHTLGAMVKNGVAMLEAIKLSSEVAGNYYYEQVWMRVHEEITNGRRIADALVEEPLFPKTLVQMIGAGEETGKLDYVLKKVSTYYDGEVETSLKTVTSLIEPLLIMVMGSVVGTIGLSLLLPIFSLSRGGH